MMITTGRNERCLGTKPLLQFKSQHPAVKIQRPFQIGDFEVDVANGDAKIN